MSGSQPGTGSEWSGVRTTYVREHVLLGSPDVIPTHLQPAEERPKPTQLTTGSASHSAYIRLMPPDHGFRTSGP